MMWGGGLGYHILSSNPSPAEKWGVLASCLAGSFYAARLQQRTGQYLHECFEYPTTEHQRLEAKELLQYLDTVNLATLGWGWPVAVQAWHGHRLQRESVASGASVSSGLLLLYVFIVLFVCWLCTEIVPAGSEAIP